MLALLLLLGLQLASSGFTLDESVAIHPDGTPVNPEAFREHVRNGEDPIEDTRLLELAFGDDLEAFTDYLQQTNYDRMFDDDGSARDIREWRQAVRDDLTYASLLRKSYPEFLALIESGTDEQVQGVLRAQHASIAGQQRAANKHEL